MKDVKINVNGNSNLSHSAENHDLPGYQGATVAGFTLVNWVRQPHWPPQWRHTTKRCTSARMPLTHPRGSVGKHLLSNCDYTSLSSSTKAAMTALPWRSQVCVNNSSFSNHVTRSLSTLPSWGDVLSNGTKAKSTSCAMRDAQSRSNCVNARKTTAKCR